MHLSHKAQPYSLNTRRVNEISLKVCFTSMPSPPLHISSIALATQTILSKIPPNNSKLTYVWEQYLFHYISEGGFTYLVMADDSAGRYVQVISTALEILRNRSEGCLLPFSESSSARYNYFI